MAKKQYIGVSNIARNCPKAYVGVNNVARKIKKAYIGVGGVARLFYTNIQVIPFTSNPVPTTWSKTSELSDSASNNYGTWSITGKANNGNGCYIGSAFDGNDTTAFWFPIPGSSSSYYTATLFTPVGVSIQVSSFKIKGIYWGSSTVLYGRVSGSSTYTKIQTIQSIGSTEKTLTFNITKEDYYDAFEIRVYKYSSQYPRLFEFQITEGTLKIE